MIERVHEPDGETSGRWIATGGGGGTRDRPARESPLLLAGDGTATFAHALLSHVVLRGERAVVLDGAGAFDPRRFAAAARARQRVIPTLLSAASVLRAGSAAAWLNLLERDAEAEARLRGAGWVIVLGALNPFCDPNLPPWQAKAGATRTAAALRHLASVGLGVVAAQDRAPLAAAAREDLLSPLRRRAGRTLEVSPSGGEQREETVPPVPVREAKAVGHVEPQRSFAFGIRDDAVPMAAGR